jgi:type IV pilus assembly protein PilE
MQQTTRTLKALYSGFTLVEVMLVLGLVAVLALLAQPIYQSYVQRGQQVHAQAILLSCAQRLQRLSLHQFNYLGHADSDGDGVGDADNGPLAAVVCEHVVDATTSYTFTVNALADGFELRATPKVGDVNAGHGVLSLDHVGLRRWDANDNGEFEADELQWPVG